MIRFYISEYIRNFWFNFCIVLLLLLMMIVSTVLISNIDEQTGTYRLAKTYMDEDSMFLSNVFRQHMDELDTYGDMLAVQVFDGGVAGIERSHIRTVVYSEEVMSVLRPRIDSGTYSENVKTNDDMVRVIISYNPYGLKAGDTFTYEVWTEDEPVVFQVYVAGVISEGQRLYTETGNVSTDMTYEDFFPIYSYQQTEQTRMIILEEELQKIPKEKIFSFYSNVMINPDDGLTAEEKTAIWEKIKNYELEFSGMIFLSPYPSALELTERNEVFHKSILMKYLPLCIIIILLFSISIIGMVMIKTIKSIRYYGIMYTCGMQYRSAQLIAGLEMAFNCVMAFMATIALLTMQEKFDIVGEINCNLDTLEVLVMMGICVVTVVSAVFTTRSVLNEHTPVEILKNTI